MPVASPPSPNIHDGFTGAFPIAENWMLSGLQLFWLYEKSIVNPVVVTVVFTLSVQPLLSVTTRETICAPVVAKECVTTDELAVVPSPKSQCQVLMAWF